MYRLPSLKVWPGKYRAMYHASRGAPRVTRSVADVTQLVELLDVVVVEVGDLSGPDPVLEGGLGPRQQGLQAFSVALQIRGIRGVARIGYVAREAVAGSWSIFAATSPARRSPPIV